VHSKFRSGPIYLNFQKIGFQHLLKTSVDTNTAGLSFLIYQHGLEFPLVAKPDNAERGKDVAVIHSIEDLTAYCNNSRFK